MCLYSIKKTTLPIIALLTFSVQTSGRPDKEAGLYTHCTVVLRNIAKFHALSLLLSKISRETLSDLFPFAVEAESFRQFFRGRILPVVERLTEYLRWDLKEDQIRHLMEEKIEKLFWKLLEARAKPSDPLKEVLGKIFEKKKTIVEKNYSFFFYLTLSLFLIYENPSLSSWRFKLS